MHFRKVHVIPYGPYGDRFKVCWVCWVWWFPGSFLAVHLQAVFAFHGLQPGATLQKRRCKWCKTKHRWEVGQHPPTVSISNDEICERNDEKSNTFYYWLHSIKTLLVSRSASRIACAVQRQVWTSSSHWGWLCTTRGARFKGGCQLPSCRCAKRLCCRNHRFSRIRENLQTSMRQNEIYKNRELDLFEVMFGCQVAVRSQITLVDRSFPLQWI